MKKYRIAKKEKQSNLWVLEERFMIVFWRKLLSVSLTAFHVYFKNEEYQMDEFLRRFGLLICAILGGGLLALAYIFLIPAIGDWIKDLDPDNKWIYLSIVLFFFAIAMGLYFIEDQKQADKDWLDGKSDKDEV